MQQLKEEYLGVNGMDGTQYGNAVLEELEQQLMVRESL